MQSLVFPAQLPLEVSVVSCVVCLCPVDINVSWVCSSTIKGKEGHPAPWGRSSSFPHWPRVVTRAHLLSRFTATERMAPGIPVPLCLTDHLVPRLPAEPSLLQRPTEAEAVHPLPQEIGVPASSAQGFGAGSPFPGSPSPGSPAKQYSASSAPAHGSAVPSPWAPGLPCPSELRVVALRKNAVPLPAGQHLARVQRPPSTQTSLPSSCP